MIKDFSLKNLALALVPAMICGRIVYALSLLICGDLLGFEVPRALAYITSLNVGIPGMIIQIILVPSIVAVLAKGGLLNVRRFRKSKSEVA